MIASVYSLLARHKSPAADDLLLEAARLGDDAERAAAVESILHRGTSRGLAGLVTLFNDLPDSLRSRLGESVERLGPAVARCARGEEPAGRVAAARFVAAVASPKLAYLLDDLLRSPSPEVFAAACDAVESLAHAAADDAAALRSGTLDGVAADAAWSASLELRGRLEEALARAFESPRGLDSAALASAATRLLERRQGVLIEAYRRQGGRAWPLVWSRLTRPADADSAAALVSCAARGPLRADLAEALARVEQPEVLDGLARDGHLLLDPACEAALSAGVGLARGLVVANVARRRPGRPHRTHRAGDARRTIRARRRPR